MTKRFQYYQDPGHGWIRIAIPFLAQFPSIYNAVSIYSYINDRYVYLEEDDDAGIFINHLRAKEIEFEFNYVHSNSQSTVRTYQSYTVRQFLNNLDKLLKRSSF